MRLLKKISIVLVIFFIVNTVINFVLDIKRQRDKERYIYLNTNQMYMEYLYINGDGIYKEQTIEYKYIDVTKKNQLYVDVAFYNFKNNEGNETSVDELLQEYKNFCNNKGSWGNLETYCDFQYGEIECAGEYDEYTYSIREYIREQYNNKKLSDASLEQINESIYIVEYLCNEYDVSMFDATETQIEEAQWNYINIGNN